MLGMMAHAYNPSTLEAEAKVSSDTQRNFDSKPKFSAASALSPKRTIQKMFTMLHLRIGKSRKKATGEGWQAGNVAQLVFKHETLVKSGHGSLRAYSSSTCKAKAGGSEA